MLKEMSQWNYKLVRTASTQRKFHSYFEECLCPSTRQGIRTKKVPITPIWKTFPRLSTHRRIKIKVQNNHWRKKAYSKTSFCQQIMTELWCSVKQNISPHHMLFLENVAVTLPARGWGQDVPLKPISKTVLRLSMHQTNRGYCKKKS